VSKRPDRISTLQVSLLHFPFIRAPDHTVVSIGYPSTHSQRECPFLLHSPTFFLQGKRFLDVFFLTDTAARCTARNVLSYLSRSRQWYQPEREPREDVLRSTIHGLRARLSLRKEASGSSMRKVQPGSYRGVAQRTGRDVEEVSTLFVRRFRV